MISAYDVDLCTQVCMWMYVCVRVGKHINIDVLTFLKIEWHMATMMDDTWQ
jgi:hypothetical protein